ncbi:MAG: ribosome biogenesis GTPase Der [Candidatus Borkfalkiaceae bacterium]|nr:ribosome biogenesis GTPase Der [Christensenellaceae bacterium]
MKPIVAIVGRPNVGKSTLFNKITGKKIAIVEDKPGVTRDRIYADAEWCGHNFTLIDTGGIELKSEDEMWRHIKKQAEIAIETADVILLLCDVKSEITASDYDVADMLRRSRKPVVLAVNKLDNYKPERLFEYYNLGLGEPFGISCEQALGLGDMLDEVCSYLDKVEEEETEGEAIKIAVVGKPNAGKSSLVNKLLGYDRTIVSDISGTTRDAIDTPFTVNGQNYILIDTAGIRKKKAVDEDVEYYSVIRALGAVRRADVCLVVVDSKEGLSEQDVKICGYVHEQGKPSVIVMNKWDLIEKDTNTINEFNKKLDCDLAFMDYYKSVYVSALSGQRVKNILAVAMESYENAHRRITTGTLNDLIGDAVRTIDPPSKKGKRLKIYYSTQDDVCPPRFVVFVNDSELVHFSYKRYLENVLRKAFDFSGTPIRILFRNRDED